jgi:hypothetical protein
VKPKKKLSFKKTGVEKQVPLPASFNEVLAQTIDGKIIRHYGTEKD